MVRRRSPPSFCTNSASSIGIRGWRPGWIISGAPVSRCAAIAARRTFFSFSVHGDVVPISPSRPARMPVSPTPVVTSAIISRARSSAVRRSMSGVRRPRKWFQNRCCAVMVTFDSSSPTHTPSGRCSSSRRRVPRSMAASSAVSAVVLIEREGIALRHAHYALRSPSWPASRCRSTSPRGRRSAARSARRA